MNYFQKERLKWIINRKKPFGRKQLMDKFEISSAQATRDITTIRKLYPNRLIYNVGKKCYEVNKEVLCRKS